MTVCHSRTRHLAEITRQAEILIVAIGQPEFITAEMVKPGGWSSTSASIAPTAGWLATSISLA